MAHIVQFRTGIAREDLEPEPRQDGSAQIIIFPGVRRERHAEPQSRPPAKGPAVRDILELPD